MKLAATLLLVIMLSPSCLASDIVGGHRNARPTDKQVIEVEGDAVTVGDLFNPPMLGNASDLQTVIIAGLRLGERRVLTPAEIKLRLREVGIDADAKGWKWSETVIVVRKAQSVSTTDLVAAGEAAIRSALALTPGDEANVEPVARPRPLLAPVGPIELSATVRAPALPGGLWTATVMVKVLDRSENEAPTKQPVEQEQAFLPQANHTWIDCMIRYRVRVMGEVIVARAAIKQHNEVTADLMSMERRELTSLRGKPVRQWEDLIGRRAARGIPAGAVITSDLLETIPVVLKGDVFQVVSRVGLVESAVQVIAQEEGGIGDIIRARLNTRNEELSVCIMGAGKGEVVQ